MNRKLLLQNKVMIYLITNLTEKISLNSRFADKVSWKSSKTSVAFVDKSGKITAKKPGTAAITTEVKYPNMTEKYTITVKVFDLGSCLYGKWKIYEGESNYNTSITAK